MEQITLFDLGLCAGRMSQEHSVQDRPTVRISARYSKKPAELRTAEYLCLDLREGYGNLLGPYWANNSPSLGAYWTLNTGASPSAAKESSLSRILQATVPRTYYLSKTAWLGILRRAAARGKELPPQLRQALEIQAGNV
jgi:hypothetical protein